MQVLIAETDGFVGALLKTGFLREGHQVVPTATAAAALEEGRVKLFDAVVLDSRLPDAAGLSVCRMLREIGPNSATTIVVMNAPDATCDLIDARSAGASRLITKPFRFADLLDCVTGSGHDLTCGGEAILTAGGVRLDRKARTVFVENKRIGLTERETILLAYFMERANKPLSRHAIFGELWETQGGVSVNVVDVYVGYLRRKLGLIAGQSPIQTVRGVGFILRSPSLS